MHWRGKGFALGQTENLHRTVARRRYNAQSGAGDASGDRHGDGIPRCGKDFGCSHGGDSSGSVMASPLIQASADGATSKLRARSQLWMIVSGSYAATCAPTGPNTLRSGAHPERLRADRAAGS
jgi:hypothetical protein